MTKKKSAVRAGAVLPKPKKEKPPRKKKTSRKKKEDSVSKFMKPLSPSVELAEVVGSKRMPRTEFVSKVWAYIKKNGLQDKKNRRMINADAKLQGIFGSKKQISMFELSKVIAKNLKK